MEGSYRFNCAATAIGSMPHRDADKACRLIFDYLAELPHWPQLPFRSNLENIIAQYSEGLPGEAVSSGTVTVNRSENFDSQIEQLYQDYDDNNYEKYAVGRERAAGLYSFVNSYKGSGGIVKGQVTGPISFGLSVTGGDGKGILYDDLLAEAAARLLRLKAAWQETFLKKIAKNVVIFVDEPSLTMLGSAFVSVPGGQVKSLIEEVLGGIHCIKGIHCCGSTDWSLLLNSSTDIISFDAYNYADSFGCYTDDVEAFIKRGGTIAWGIVPNVEENMRKETVNSLMERLEAAMAAYTNNGITMKQIASQSIVTPSCTLGALTEDTAANTLKLLSDLSVKAQKKFGL